MAQRKKIDGNLASITYKRMAPQTAGFITVMLNIVTLKLSRIH